VGTPPTGIITLPSEGTTFNAGDTVSYTGTAADFEDGSLPPAAFSWTVILHHHYEEDPLHHAHPYQGPIDGVDQGSFTISTGAHDHDIWFRIHLTVTDSDGLIHQSARDIFPNLSTITLQTDPTGLMVKLDGQRRTAPVLEESIVGSVRLIGAFSQMFNGEAYRFESWSDGGADTHTITTLASNATFTVTYAIIPDFEPSKIGHWKLDEVNGLTAADSSGSDNHGTLVNGPTWDSGQSGGGLLLDGINDYVEVALDHPETNYTFALWIKTGTADQGISRVASPLSPTTGAQDRNLAIDAGGNLKHRLWNCQETITTSGVSVVDNQWHHVAVAVESGVGQKIYVDGVVRASGTCGTSNFNYESGLILGGDGYLSTGTYFQGLLDEVRLYTRVLSDAEIGTLP